MATFLYRCPSSGINVQAWVKYLLLAVAWFAVPASNSATARGGKTLMKWPPLVRTTIRPLARQASPAAVVGGTAMPALTGA